MDSLFMAVMEMPDFGSPAIWVSLLTLVFLEIVLGVDNIIFISIISGKLPESQQPKARTIGLAFAMIFRIIMLLGINWIIGLTKPVLTLDFMAFMNEGQPLSMTWKDIILLAGGLFLMGKSTMEIHHKMTDHEHAQEQEKSAGAVAKKAIGMVIFQIILVDLVFSLDSILTAVGLVDNVIIMIIAVVISIGVMMVFAGKISRIVNKYPSLQMLALSFLVVIGVLLVAESVHHEIPKNIIYSCLAFSLIVETLNIRFRNKQDKVKMKQVYTDEDLKNV